MRSLFNIIQKAFAREKGIIDAMASLDRPSKQPYIHMPYEIRLSYDAKLNDEYEDFDSWHRAVSDFVMDKAKGHHPSTPIAIEGRNPILGHERDLHAPPKNHTRFSYDIALLNNDTLLIKTNKAIGKMEIENSSFWRGISAPSNEAAPLSI